MAQAAQPTGPVTHGKAWVEMVHRYLATGVGFLILVLAIATWVARRRQRRPDHRGERALSAWWPAATLAWVCLQGAFGALTVTWKLFPAIVTLHLMGAVVLLALLCIQAVRYQQAATQRLPTPLASPLRGLLVAATALLALQIALGGWVSTNYAVLACTGFPQCNGQWWPAMNWAEGFTFMRELGRRGDGAPIAMTALVAIQWAHRLFALVFVAAMGWLVARLWRRGPTSRRRAVIIGGLVVLQLATGLSNVVLGWPLVAALAHTAGAAALVICIGFEIAAALNKRTRVLSS
jgi:cytochrome c oxidase assembly protein subunit 15